MAGKKRMDPDSEAAVEMVRTERRREELADLDSQYREKLIAQVHEIIGRIQGVRLVSQFGDVASLVWIKQVKDSKIYRDVPGIGSWETFCEILGLSRRKVDEDLQNLETFGEEFLATVASFKVGYRELRKLRYAAQQGELIIDTEAVTIGDEKIPLAPDHAEDLEAAIDALLETKARELKEKEGVIKAKERIIKSHQETINKQEIEIERFKREAKERGFAPGEEAFLKWLGRARVHVTGYLHLLDPQGDDLMQTMQEATPRMKAAYMELVGFIRRWATANHDTAVDSYGDPDMDGGWVPGRGAELDAAKLDGGDSILLENCRLCKAAHPECDKCCATCLTPCNLKQECRWPSAKS